MRKYEMTVVATHMMMSGTSTLGRRPTSSNVALGSRMTSPKFFHVERSPPSTGRPSGVVGRISPAVIAASCCRSSLVVILGHRLGPFPSVEPLPGLLTELPLRDELAQDARRREARSVDGSREVLGDCEPHVEADQVGELERPHGVVVAELHRGVDVG